jgi:DNA-binding FadR family transcriptional regulator
MDDRLESQPKAQLLHLSVQDRLKEYIAANKLGCGDPLPPEGELARRLGVSRNSVREAVKGLESLGVIESRRGIGVFVAEFSFGPLLDHLPYGFNSSLRDVTELMEVRKTLEVALIGRVLDIVPPERLQELDGVLEAMRAKAEQGQGFPEADEIFHSTLFACLGNRILDRLIAVFWQAFHKATRFFDMQNQDPMKTYRDHVEIVAALRARDADRARRALETHYQGIGTVLALNAQPKTP